MAAAQYWLALLTIVIVPPAGLVWFIVHPFARFWRRAGLAITYTVVLAVVFALAGAVVLSRHWLLSVRYGVSWPLVAVAIVLAGAALAVAAPGSCPPR